MEKEKHIPSAADSEARLAWKLTTASSSSIFVFGIVMAILGAILPQLVGRLDLQRAQAGNLFFFMNLGMLAATLVFGPVVDRFGFKLLLALSSLVVGLAFAGLAFSGSYRMVMLSVVFLGLAGGVLNGGSNALVNDLHPRRRAAALNFLGVFFGFGAMMVPLIIGGFLKQLGLRPVVLIPAGLSLVPFVLFLSFSFPRPKLAQGFPLKDVKHITRSGLLWLTAFILFFQSGNEFSVGGWLSSYFQERYNFSLSRSALVLSGYWFFLIVGRFIYPVLNRVWKRETVVLAGAFLALISLAGLILSPTGWLAVVFAMLIGLGFAAIYPTTLAVIGEKFPQFSGTAFSLAISTGLVGGMLSPWLIGRVSQNHSLRTALLVPLFNLAMILILQLAVRKKILSESGQHIYNSPQRQ